MHDTFHSYETVIHERGELAGNITRDVPNLGSADVLDLYSISAQTMHRWLHVPTPGKTAPTYRIDYEAVELA